MRGEDLKFWLRVCVCLHNCKVEYKFSRQLCKCTSMHMHTHTHTHTHTQWKPPRLHLAHNTVVGL